MTTGLQKKLNILDWNRHYIPWVGEKRIVADPKFDHKFDKFPNSKKEDGETYSTVTDFAKFLGLSTSNPRLAPM